MTVSTPAQPDSTTQAPPSWGAAVDGEISVFMRLAAAFAPHAQSTPDMTVHIDAGHIFSVLTLTEVAAQSTGTITAPVSHDRIDRVVIDRASGVVSVITGSENISPTAPTITSGKCPVAQILLHTSSTVIANSMITDERDLSWVGKGTAAALDSDTDGTLSANSDAKISTQKAVVTYVTAAVAAAAAATPSAGPTYGMLAIAL